MFLAKLVLAKVLPKAIGVMCLWFAARFRSGRYAAITELINTTTREYVICSDASGLRDREKPGSLVVVLTTQLDRRQ